MTTLTIFLAGFSLATFAWAIFYALILLHRPRYVAPTKHRRKWRDAPERHLFSELQEGMQELERRREEGIDYQWINLTGEER